MEQHTTPDSKPASFGPESRLVWFEDSRTEKSSLFSQRGYLDKLKEHLKAVFPLLSVAARDAVAETANTHGADWSMVEDWPSLSPFVGQIAAATAVEPVDDPALLERLKTLHLQMRWRRAREQRLMHASQHDFFRNGPFVAWLLQQPAEILSVWAREFVRRPTSGAKRDTAFRLSRLRPMPLPVLCAWQDFQHRQVADAWNPTSPQLRVHAVVSAGAQWLEWNRHFRMRYFRPPSPVRRLRYDPIDVATSAFTQAAADQLTIPEAVFEKALKATLDKLNQAAVPDDRDDGPFRLRVVSLVQRKAPLKSQFHVLRCAACTETELRHQERQLPPYQLGCTCQAAFDWETAPVDEAPYDWALARWVESLARGFSYGFPARRLLFKLNEEELRRPSRGL